MACTIMSTPPPLPPPAPGVFKGITTANGVQNVSPPSPPPPPPRTSRNKRHSPQGMPPPVTAEAWLPPPCPATRAGVLPSRLSPSLTPWPLSRFRAAAAKCIPEMKRKSKSTFRRGRWGVGGGGGEGGGGGGGGVVTSCTPSPLDQQPRGVPRRRGRGIDLTGAIDCQSPRRSRRGKCFSVNASTSTTVWNKILDAYAMREGGRGGGHGGCPCFARLATLGFGPVDVGNVLDGENMATVMFVAFPPHNITAVWALC